MPGVRKSQNNTSTYDKSETMKHLGNQLEMARKKLEQMMAKESKDEKGIAKLQEIIDNISQTIRS